MFKRLNVILLFKVKRNPKIKNPKVKRTKSRRIMLLPVYNSKKLTFLTEQKARRVLSNLLGVKAPILSDILILNTLLQNY